MFSVAPVGDFEGSQTVWPASLSKYDLSFSVGGTSEDGVRHWSTSALSASSDPEGGTLDIVAPAENVFSTLGVVNGTSTYGSRNSTVGSAAMAAGVVGLLKETDPSLQPDDLRQIIRRTADDIPPQGYDRQTGHGLLNARAAVDYVRNRSFTRGTATNGTVTVLDDDNVSFTMLGGPWTSLGGGKYFVNERYKVQWTIDLPPGADHDVWVRLPGTKGWSSTNPTTGTPHATISVRSWESKATITTYGYQGYQYDTIGRRIGVYGYPVRAADARVAYTIATKPGSPPPPPLSVSISGPVSLQSDQTGTWSVNVSGGSGTTRYQWYVKSFHSSSFTKRSGATAASFSTSFRNSTQTAQSATVKVVVERGNAQVSATKDVVVLWSPSCGIDCPVPFAKQGLPITDFNVALEHDVATLTWRHAGFPSPSFIVEHRTDSLAAWSALGTAHGTRDRPDPTSSSDPRFQHYRFQVEDLPFGSHQFRLTVGDRKSDPWHSETLSTTRLLSASHTLRLYPNPTLQRATLELVVHAPQRVSVHIYDLLGRLVTVAHDDRLSAQNTVRVPIDTRTASLSPGTYFVRVTGERFKATERLVVIR